MALRKAYELINSEFNEFLFAPIGEAGNGMTLNVMSALTRLDIDPWKEAAKLSELSKEKAVDILAPIVARVPDAHWALADSRAIATRLVACLPWHNAVGPSRATPAEGRAKPGARTKFLLMGLAVAAALLFLATSRPQAPPSDGRAPTETSVPLAR